MDDRSAQIVEELQAEIRQLRRHIEQLESENRRLREQLEQAQQLAARQAAPFRREDRAKILPEQQKRPGSKPGHTGHYRIAPDHIDQTIRFTLPPISAGVVQVNRKEE